MGGLLTETIDSPNSAPGFTKSALGGARLENYANKFSPEPRNTRYNRRSGLWVVSSLERCRRCGKSVRTRDGDVPVRLLEGRAGFAGLVSCGSVWVCPVCSSKVMARRALEIGSAVAVGSARGLDIAFITLTMRHNRRQKLGDLWDGLANGWHRVTGGKGWSTQIVEFGVLGYLRVVEVTIGDNGWHVHVHALVFGERIGSGLDDLAMGMWGRWSGGLKSVGLGSPLPQASEWHFVTDDLTGTALGEYLSKGIGSAAAIGMEMTQTQSKVARSVHVTRPPWSLLDEGALDGEAAPLRLWHEWEKGSKGRRQIAWSRDLRQLLGLVELVKSDEEIAAEEIGTRDSTIVVITRAGWSELIYRPWLIPDVLNVAERFGSDGLSEWLSSFGIEHRRVA